MRTVDDFVEDMLEHGRDWIAIMAVARFIRGGYWYDNIKLNLQKRKLMPIDEATIIKNKEEAIKSAKIEEVARYAKNKVKRGRVGSSGPIS